MLRSKYALFLVIILTNILWCDDETFDPFSFLDDVASISENIVSLSIKAIKETNTAVRQRRPQNRRRPIVLNRINNRDIKEGEAEDVFVIGSHRGTNITSFLEKNFGEVFSIFQIKKLETQINSVVSRTTRSFENSAFLVNSENASLEAFVKANDFAGRDGRTFQHSDLIGKKIGIGQSNFNIVSARNFSPIIIDLDGNGKPDVTKGEWLPHAPKFFAKKTALFDITGDGKVEFMEWLGPKDGLLVLPELNGDVKNGHNLFGTAGGYKDGYAKMALNLDFDENGWIEKEELAGLYIWRDKNGDAQAQKKELKKIQLYGIKKISVHHDKFSSICYMNGKKTKTWDWWPAGFTLEKE